MDLMRRTSAYISQTIFGIDRCKMFHKSHTDLKKFGWGITAVDIEPNLSLICELPQKTLVTDDGRFDKYLLVGESRLNSRTLFINEWEVVVEDWQVYKHITIHGYTNVVFLTHQKGKPISMISQIEPNTYQSLYEIGVKAKLMSLKQIAKFLNKD